MVCARQYLTFRMVTLRPALPRGRGFRGMSTLLATFAAATVTSDADVSAVCGALADIATAARLKAAHAALVAEELRAEESGDEAAWLRAMNARDAWEAETSAAWGAARGSERDGQRMRRMGRRRPRRTGGAVSSTDPYAECRRCGCWHYTRGKRKCSSPHGHDFTPPRVEPVTYRARPA